MDKHDSATSLDLSYHHASGISFFFRSPFGVAQGRKESTHFRQRSTKRTFQFLHIHTHSFTATHSFKAVHFHVEPFPAGRYHRFMSGNESLMRRSAPSTYDLAGPVTEDIIKRRWATGQNMTISKSRYTCMIVNESGKKQVLSSGDVDSLRDYQIHRIVSAMLHVFCLGSLPH